MIPDYQTLMLPVLKAAENGEIYTQDVADLLAEEFSLSDQEKEHLLPSGKQRTFHNRINWAKSYLKQAGLVRYTKRGYYELTDRGREIVKNPPPKINNSFLENYKEFQDFKHRSAKGSVNSSEEINEDVTPDEEIRIAYKRINSALSTDLLDRVRIADPFFFEELIVELLLAMGYGGTAEEAGRSLGRSGDGGVDGVIDQDPLGVDQVYVQAKRYAEGNNIGSGAIRDFFGALNLKKAQKGIFFTTSSFSSSAVQTARDLGTRIVLIDGIRLSKLMIQYGIGCRTEEVLYIKKVDEDFFDITK